MDTWKENNLLNLINQEEEINSWNKGVKFTETSFNRFKQHGEDGLIIVSTSRSVIVPIELNNNNQFIRYIWESWQSLFNEYVEFCHNNNINVFEENIKYNTVEEYIEYSKDKGDCINKKSSHMYLLIRNKRCDEELFNELRNKENPYTFTPTYGGFIGITGESSDREYSFIVYNSLNHYKNKIGNWDDLLMKALNWCKKYKQDMIYVQAPNEAPIYLDKEGNKISSKSTLDFIYRRNGNYYTNLNRNNKLNKRITADIEFEEFTLRPSYYNGPLDKIKRYQKGEICLED